MKVLNIEGMHCEGCVKRIKDALTAAGLDFEVSLENKTVTVNGDDTAVKTAAEEIFDLGFNVK